MGNRDTSHKSLWLHTSALFTKKLHNITATKTLLYGAFFPIYSDQGNGFTTQCVILDSKPAQEVAVMHMETDGIMCKTLTPRVHKMEDALEWSGQ